MALTTTVKNALNVLLKPMNLKLDSLTVENRERERITEFEKNTGYDKPVYALSPGMMEFNPSVVARLEAEYRDGINRLKDPSRNDTGYIPGNSYFETPDVDVLYMFVRHFKPERVVEVGCGNSTRVTRQAILDGSLSSKITAIDPLPRADIAHLVDRFEQVRLETLQDMSLFTELQSNDILFIDSSHEVRTANDVAHLFCRILPELQSGVFVHVHDIFLPFEYPKDMAESYPSWGEQYILHALISGDQYEILWPGVYLQQLRADLHDKLPFLREGRAQSFWIKKK